MAGTQKEYQTAVGACVTFWASVELQQDLMFRCCFPHTPDRASEVWASVVSFDARTAMLHRAMLSLLTDAEDRQDLALLLNYCRKLYKQRNRIAHATIVAVSFGSEQCNLVPFLNLADRKRAPIPLPELADTAAKFLMLFEAMAWFNNFRHPHPIARIASPPPLPDLIQELRDEESRLRKGQQGRARLLRHAEKLASEGRLPDWPPADE